MSKPWHRCLWVALLLVMLLANNFMCKYNITGAELSTCTCGAESLTDLLLFALLLQYKAVEPDDNLPMERVERRMFTVDDMKQAQEVFAMNTFLGVVGISHIDNEWIGDDEENLEQCGPVSLALNEMLHVDRNYKKGSTRHTEVPYGYMTGMVSQLV